MTKKAAGAQSDLENAWKSARRGNGRAIMRVGTIVSLGASAVLGVGALLVAKVWLPAAAASQEQAKGHVEAPQTVPVVVATSAIPYGGKVDAGHLTIAQLPASA